MYTVTIINGDTEAVINEISVNSNRRIYSATIEKAINAIHTFNFTINILHPEYENIKERLTRLKITYKNKITFDGYVLKLQEYMDSSGKFYKQVVCESAIGYLYDSVQTSSGFPFYSAETLLAFMLVDHNSQVEYHKRINFGSVVEEPQNPPSVYTTAYTNSYNVLSTFIETYGGEFYLTYEDDVRKLNYTGTTYIPTTAEQNPIIQLARNLQSMDTFVDGSQIITRIFPYGAKINDTETRVDISSVNGGKLYIDDDGADGAMGIYGIIGGVKFFDDITDPQTLKNLGIVFLNENNYVKKSYTISALDLETIGLDTNGFELGGEYHLVNPIMGIDTRLTNQPLRVTKITLDINAPHKSAIEIGERVQSISSISAKSAQLLKNGMAQIEQQAVSNAVANADKNTDAKIEDMLTKTEANNTYLKTAIAQTIYATIAGVNTALQSYASLVLLSEVQTALQAEIDLLKTATVDGSRITGTINGVNLTTNTITLTGYDLAQKIIDIESRLP